MAWVKRVDHVTYAVAQGMIEKWAWYHIEIEGGRLVHRIDDVSPDSPDSSMKLWCIDYDTFGIALVEGIDRKKKSQVTAFAEKHGDHTVQHVAYDTGDLEGFLRHLTQFGAHSRGQNLYAQRRVRDSETGLLQRICQSGPSRDVFPGIRGASPEGGRRRGLQDHLLPGCRQDLLFPD